jgi:hypothetical protein
MLAEKNATHHGILEWRFYSTFVVGEAAAPAV